MVGGKNLVLGISRDSFLCFGLCVFFSFPPVFPLCDIDLPDWLSSCPGWPDVIERCPAPLRLALAATCRAPDVQAAALSPGVQAAAAE